MLTSYLVGRGLAIAVRDDIDFIVVRGLEVSGLVRPEMNLSDHRALGCRRAVDVSRDPEYAMLLASWLFNPGALCKIVTSA